MLFYVTYCALPLTAADCCARVGNGVSAEEFYEQFYVKQQPVIISGAARDWPGRLDWNVSSVFKLVQENVGDPKELECVTKVEEDSSKKKRTAKDQLALLEYNSPHYEDVVLESVLAFFSYLRRCIAGQNEGHRHVGLKNGISIPYRKLREECPVPPLLEKLHKVLGFIFCVYCQACTSFHCERLLD